MDLLIVGLEQVYKIWIDFKIADLSVVLVLSFVMRVGIDYYMKNFREIHIDVAVD